MKRTFGIIGGDQRQAELAKLLAAEGHEVYTYGLDRWSSERCTSLDRALSAPVVILPLPLCREEGMLNCDGVLLSTQELFQQLRPEQRVLAGQIKPQQLQEAAKRGLLLEDYFLRGELTIANAAMTAEGAIQVAMENLDRTLLNMECLVIGFGRIGKLLSHRLHGIGAKVSATARKREDLAWIRAYGWRALDTEHLDGHLSSYSVVFNTVPSLVLNEYLLAQLPADCLCIDLASCQGIDLLAAEKRKLPYVWARGLPGHLVPHTAAAMIRDTIDYILLER
ncbi:MAG: dipicolinate synthase subunit DpsA [Oscillibacter sp.]|nr:dipicolinate synthase subunit DpsA [Oscillibacter sp.]